MPNLTPFQYQEWLAQQQAKLTPQRTSENAVERESDLHDQIIAYCGKHWPKWKYIRARMDKKSTIGVGVSDFTIFMPAGRVVCIECKRKGEKPTEAQLIWAKELSMLGHQVHFCWSMDDFLAAVL